MGSKPSVQLAHAPATDLLGRYELLSLLAKGGMGEVHLGRMRGLAGFRKLVVIKRNIPSTDDATRSQMLFAEARLVATLQHANIVQVYDVGHEGTTVFVAMEFLHGQDLRTVMKRSWGAGKPLSLEYAIASTLAVCAGLQYAHDKRDGDGIALEIVHRDVSPSNVFVTYDGSVKLIDFGIAKATSLPSETQLGTIKGKPGYMSPEQCNGESLDRRSDVFCVGILLYELTTGRSPFRGETEYKTLQAILELDPPRPTELDASYPAALDAIVMRALAKDRRDRYATAAALQDDLAAFVREHRLDVSQFEVGRSMAALFADEIAGWREAQRAGQSLEDYVIGRTTGTLDARPPPEPARVASARNAGSSMLPTQLVAETPPARTRRPWLVVGALGLAAAIVTAVFVLRASSEATATTAPPTASAPSSSTKAPEAAATTSPEAPATTPAPLPSPPTATTDEPTRRPARTTKPKPSRRKRASGDAGSSAPAPIDPDGVW